MKKIMLKNYKEILTSNPDAEIFLIYFWTI